MDTLRSHALEDEDYRVPVAPPADRGVGWLRAHVVRFSEGGEHRRRRRPGRGLGPPGAGRLPSRPPAWSVPTAPRSRSTWSAHRSGAVAAGARAKSSGARLATALVTA